MNSDKTTFCALIPAAGSGSRMKSHEKKQFLNIGGRPIICHTIRAFLDSGTDHIVLVVPKEDLERFEGLLKEEFGDEEQLNVDLIIGGNSRTDSVYRGLSLVKEDYVLIHDGARPFVDRGIIERCKAGAVEYGAAIAAVPVRDTIKIGDLSGEFVEETPDRRRLYGVQTPQAFNTEIIKSAYNKIVSKKNIGFSDFADFTDDASVAEAAGIRVKIVEGSYRNIKISVPEDLAIAEVLHKI